MRRRQFITLLGGAMAWPFVANGQSSKVHRVALVFSTSPVSEMAGPDPFIPSARAFVHGLRDLGYVEGQNLILERRSAEGHFERYPEIFEELIRLNVDVIVTVNAPMAQAAKAVTTTVPIVMAGTRDPVESGLVNSLARPGGNITGVSSFVGMEIEAKRLQLLKEALPGITRVAYLGTIEDWETWGKSVRPAAQALGLRMILAEHTTTEYKDAFALLGGGGIDALFVSPGSFQYANRQSIVDFARRARLPDIHSYQEAVHLGALMSYGVNIPDQFRRAATYVDRILKGAEPAELPIEQPTKFEFVINTKTAKALGLTIPPTLLAQADGVIE